MSFIDRAKIQSLIIDFLPNFQEGGIVDLAQSMEPEGEMMTKN